MRTRPILPFLVLCISGAVLGTLGTWAWDLGHGYSALWPALVVQVAGSIWFGAWGVIAAALFPMFSNAVAQVGLMGVLGYIPANIAQGLIPAWAFRHYRVDPSIPGRRGLLFYLLWGAAIPSLAGGVLGSLAVILFGKDSWTAYPLLAWKWAAPHVVVSAAIGIPVLRIFTPLWRDMAILVRGWWRQEARPAYRPRTRRFRDLPIQLKLAIAMCGLGLSPLLVIAIVQLSRQGGGKFSSSTPTPLFLTLSLVASILAVGWLSREVVRPLLDLKDRVDDLIHGRAATLAISREDEIGQVTRAFEVLLAERRQAEEEVRRSQAELQAFVENAPYGITRASVNEDRFLSVNPAIVKMLGYSSQEEVLALCLSRDVYLDRNSRRELIADLSRTGEYCSVELLWKRKDGRPISIRGGARVIPAGPGSDDMIIEAIEEDITHGRMLEEQLRQAQKMEAVGRLAGGVAHDFNNLLGVILGYGELLGRDMPPDPNVRRKLEAIVGAAERAAALTSQLLAFSRKQVLQPKVVSLNAVVADTEKMLERVIGEHIELRMLLHPGLVQIKADPGQVAQVIMNLAVNARDAMPTGGILTFETLNVELDREIVHEGVAVPTGRYAVLKVTDTGTGMDPETRSRIFEPFFTTKGVGQGTGLGLATVYGIIAQSAAHIVVHSELGKGSSFEIYFPEHRGSNSDTHSKEAPGQALRGTETILVVEDAAELRALICDGLQMNGYRVLSAANGPEALEIVKAYPGRIDLLISDILMPGMGGAELVQRAAVHRPHTKVLFMSGYAHDTVFRGEGSDPKAVFIQKPFTFDALSKRLREILDQKQP